MKTFRHFCGAFLVAVWFSLIRWDHPGRRARSFLTLLLQDGEKAPGVIPWVRDQHCKRCPIYYAKLGTCGSPLDKDLVAEDGSPLGCWCFTRYKNRLKFASCWLRDNTGGTQGWPKELIYERTAN